MLASLKRIVNRSTGYIQCSTYHTNLQRVYRTPASPPTPVKIPDIQLHHGKKRIDNFSWMEQLDHPVNIDSYWITPMS